MSTQLQKQTPRNKQKKTANCMSNVLRVSIWKKWTSCCKKTPTITTCSFTRQRQTFSEVNQLGCGLNVRISGPYSLEPTPGSRLRGRHPLCFKSWLKTCLFDKVYSCGRHKPAHTYDAIGSNCWGISHGTLSPSISLPRSIFTSSALYSVMSQYLCY